MVACQEDDSVRTNKSNTKMYYDFPPRRDMIHSIRYLDEMVPYHKADKDNPNSDFDIFVAGGDQLPDGFQRTVNWGLSQGRKVERFAQTPYFFSSQLRDLQSKESQPRRSESSGHS